jgi:uncharacterized repeat protein (TIGR01451 family)
MPRANLTVTAATMTGAFVVATGILGPGWPVSAADAPTPSGSAPTDPQLSIAIDNGHTTAAPGERLVYTITIRNVGASDAQELRITQTLPPGLEFISADHNGVADSSRITWVLDLKAGAESKLSTVGQVGQTPDELLRLAAVACAAAKDADRPLVCATHSDLLPAGAVAAAPGPSPLGWIRYAIGATALLLVGLGTWLLARRRRSRRRTGAVPLQAKPPAPDVHQPKNGSAHKQQGDAAKKHDGDPASAVTGDR